MFSATSTRVVRTGKRQRKPTANKAPSPPLCPVVDLHIYVAQAARAKRGPALAAILSRYERQPSPSAAAVKATALHHCAVIDPLSQDMSVFECATDGVTDSMHRDDVNGKLADLTSLVRDSAMKAASTGNVAEVLTLMALSICKAVVWGARFSAVSVMRSRLDLTVSLQVMRHPQVDHTPDPMRWSTVHAWPQATGYCARDDSLAWLLSKLAGRRRSMRVLAFTDEVHRRDVLHPLLQSTAMISTRRFWCALDAMANVDALPADDADSPARFYDLVQLWLNDGSCAALDVKPCAGCDRHLYCPSRYAVSSATGVRFLAVCARRIRDLVDPLLGDGALCFDEIAATSRGYDALRQTLIVFEFFVNFSRNRYVALSAHKAAMGAIIVSLAVPICAFANATIYGLSATQWALFITTCVVFNADVVCAILDIPDDVLDAAPACTMAALVRSAGLPSGVTKRLTSNFSTCWARYGDHHGGAPSQGTDSAAPCAAPATSSVHDTVGSNAADRSRRLAA